jgi:hypothetical protein
MDDEVVTMATREIDRLHVIRRVLAGELSWRLAGEQLDLSVRQVGRLCARVRRNGARGIVHGLRGRRSNRCFEPVFWNRVAVILKDPKWEGFGPTFASDKLAGLHGIEVRRETLRKWMMRMGLWKASRHRRRHRCWRERRACIGMLVQLDGSDHDWFEGRGPRCVLIIYIDDATSRILYGEFVKVEDTLTLLRTTGSYLRRCGRPVALYVDKDSIYKVNRTAAAEEDATLPEPLTQFARAMDELGIEVIWAHSPQAKGRVERGFKTHQDRLVKELRLAGISTIEAANALLRERYIPEHNARYAMPPKQAADAHRPLLAAHRLERILALRHERVVQNDFTVQRGKTFLQILAQPGLRLRPTEKVQLETRLDGSLHVRYREAYLKFKRLDARPYRPQFARTFPRKEQVEPIRLRPMGASNPGSRKWLYGNNLKGRNWHASATYNLDSR